MKAYLAWFDEEDWYMLVHGETRAQAKYNFLRWNPMDGDRSSWVYIRLRREPSLDDLPFTPENLEKTGNYFITGEYNEAGDEIVTFDIDNDCHCKVCHGALQDTK